MEVEQVGNTFEQVFLGSRTIDTQDPENIEAMLSTQFNGLEPKQQTTIATECLQNFVWALDQKTFVLY